MSLRVKEWYEEYHQEIYNYLIYLCRSKDVEDYLQEVFVIALQKEDQFAGKSSAKTWLFSIARNLVIDDWRKKERRNKILSMFKKDLIERVTPDNDFFLEYKESQKQLMCWIGQLTIPQQEIIILRGINDFSIKECAAILDWPESKVTLTYHRALKKLQLLKDGDIHVE